MNFGLESMVLSGGRALILSLLNQIQHLGLDEGKRMVAYDV